MSDHISRKIGHQSTNLLGNSNFSELEGVQVFAESFLVNCCRLSQWLISTWRLSLILTKHSNNSESPDDDLDRVSKLSCSWRHDLRGAEGCAACCLTPFKTMTQSSAISVHFFRAGGRAINLKPMHVRDTDPRTMDVVPNNADGLSRRDTSQALTVWFFVTN